REACAPPQWHDLRVGKALPTRRAKCFPPPEFPHIHKKFLKFYGLTVNYPSEPPLLRARCGPRLSCFPGITARGQPDHVHLCGEGMQKWLRGEGRGKRIFVWEVELAEDQPSRGATDEKIIPFDGGPDRRCNDRLAQLSAVLGRRQPALRGSSKCGRACHCLQHSAPFRQREATQSQPARSDKGSVSAMSAGAIPLSRG